jgi:hypothetical protein
MSDDKILNPDTGRYVSITGKIGKEILKKQGKKIQVVDNDATKSEAKTDTPKDKIMNPETGRYVSITGKIGKQLLKSQKKSSVVKQDPKPTKIKSKPSKSKSKTSPDQNKLPQTQKDINNIIFNNGNIQDLQSIVTGLPNITFTDEKYQPFLFKFNESTAYESQISTTDGEFIHGHFKKTIHFIIQKNGKQCDLIIQISDTHLLIKNIENARNSKESYPCDMFYLKSKPELNDKVEQECREFFELLFGPGQYPKNFKVKLHPFVLPAAYEQDNTVQHYNFSKPPPTVSIMDQEQGQYDPCFVSNIDKDIVFVFHIDKPDGRTMKGYTPIGISVVHRRMRKVNYKYTNLLRLTLPSWGVYFGDNVEELSVYMKEMRNIIISNGFLTKFRGFSPYPRIITGCKLSPERNQLRQCL